MKATEILGPKAMTFLEWFRWLNHDRVANDYIDAYHKQFPAPKAISAVDVIVLMVESAHDLLSKSFDIELAEKAFEGDFTFDTECNFAQKSNEWGYVDMKFVKTVDDFIRECQKEGIELFYHKDYEI